MLTTPRSNVSCDPALPSFSDRGNAKRVTPLTERELLADCLRRLNGIGLPYMLTGSMASNFWGIPRTTHDLDFVLSFEEDRVTAIVSAFEDDYALEATSVRRAFQRHHMFNAIDRRSALKIDFWMLRRVPFEENMFARRLRVTLFGEPAWIATAEDTLLHKLYWNRITPSERQIGDAAGIVAVQGAELDRDYLEHWARELGVVTVLSDLLDGKIRPKST
jgi:hypothetical protein